MSRPLNLIGYPGSYLADVLLQFFGAAAFLIPLLTFLLAWKWIRSEDLEAGAVKVFGSVAADHQPVLGALVRAGSPL